MSDILQIFTGNPLATFIGKKVEAATRPELESEDWALNLDICDIINDNDDDAKDAVRAIKKRLQQSEQERNFTMTNRTLTVLETCVSNCSRRFHVLVMTKDFIQNLVKLIGPKNNPPIDLQERVLRLIERWTDAFRDQPDLGGVVAVYHELKAKGVTFPPPDPSKNVPIQTPQRSVPPPQPPVAFQMAQPIAQAPFFGPVGGAGILPPSPQPPISQVVLEGDGYNKISQDLTVVQTSIEMFTEILRVLETKSDESDWSLAAELNTTCRQMKDRIMDLIERVANEDLIIELLRLNDELVSIFSKYDSLVVDRASALDSQARQAPSENLQTGSSRTETPSGDQRPTTNSSRGVENELSLIDFNASDEPSDESRETKPLEVAKINDPFDTSKIFENTQPTSTRQQSLADDLSKLNLSGPAGSGPQASASSSATRVKNLPDEIKSVREQDFAEIEHWLKNDSGKDLDSIIGDTPSIEPISVPNSEFENFIANRALIGAQTTTTNPATKPTSQKPEPSA